MKVGRKRSWAFALLVAALACVAIGVAQGGYMDTLRKAAVICLECIGIG